MSLKFITMCSIHGFVCWRCTKQNKYPIKPQNDTLDLVCLTFLWLQRTWQSSEGAWRVLTPFLVFFFFRFFFSLCQSYELIDATKAGEGDEAWASSVNRCVGSLPCWNGSRSRCTAVGRGPHSCIHVHAPSLPACVETRGREDKTAGFGFLSKPNLARS